MKEAFTGSYYKGEPNYIEGWAYKSAGFFMQQFVMLAQSKGWGMVFCIFIICRYFVHGWIRFSKHQERIWNSQAL